MSEIAVRFVVPAGRRAWLRVYWSMMVWPEQGEAAGYVVSDGKGCNGRGYHNAMVHLVDGALGDEDLGGRAADYPDERWPAACDHCGALVPSRLEAAVDERRVTPGLQVNRQVFRRTLYAPPSGGAPDDIKPGDMYYADWYPCAEGSPHCIHGWENCDGKHLFVRLPDGQDWDTNARANNCSMPNDRKHRCWVRHGRPELGEVVHVDKNGVTCAAGAGSIATSKYHGFLHNGRLRPC